MNQNNQVPLREVVDVVVLGAGLTGLCLAHWLGRMGVSYRLVERSERIGGQIQSISRDGFVFETGPNTGIISRPEVADLFASLGQGNLLQIANREARRRLILKDGEFRPLPSGAWSAIRTNLFDWRDKLRILAEPFRARGADPNESIASLVRRRLGRSYLHYAVDPFVGGIYAGDPEMLTTRFALPKLYALEAEHGSFVRGAIAKMRQPKSERERLATRETFSVRGGLSRLVEVLGQSIETQLCLSARVESIAYEGDHWQTEVVYEGGRASLHSRYIVSTIGGYALSEVFPWLGEARLSPLSALRYAPVVQVAVGYRDARGIAFDAFGGLVPSCEDAHLLGILNPSACFSGRAPDGGLLLSVFAGGMRSPNFINRSDEEIADFVLDRLASILGISATPDLLHISRHRYAIPQYEVSTGDRLAMIEHLEQEYRGLILAGNIRDGIGMADRMAQAQHIARSIAHQEGITIDD